MEGPLREIHELRRREAGQNRGLRAMSMGFGFGSVLFAGGALLGLVGGSMLIQNTIFAVGAVFFTVAALVQWRRSVAHAKEHGVGRPEWDWSNPDWSSAIIQFAGTIEFNVMTLRALRMTVESAGSPTLVWRPDVLGSALFLVSSVIALDPVSRGYRHWTIGSRSARICWANLAGSVFFGISAGAARPIGETAVSYPAINNWTTLLGALGFLLASALSWPPRNGRASVQPRGVAA